MYENVVLRGKDGAEQAACLFANLHSEAPIAYRAKFIVRWSLTTESQYYATV